MMSRWECWLFLLEAISSDDHRFSMFEFHMQSLL
jgi:hypothetical protein